MGNLVVYISPEHGRVRELSGGALASWVGINPAHAQDPHVTRNWRTSTTPGHKHDPSAAKC